MEGSLQGGIDDVGSAEERKLSLDRNLTFALVPWSDGSVGPVGTCWDLLEIQLKLPQTGTVSIVGVSFCAFVHRGLWAKCKGPWHHPFKC